MKNEIPPFGEHGAECMYLEQAIFTAATAAAAAPVESSVGENRNTPPSSGDERRVSPFSFDRLLSVDDDDDKIEASYKKTT